MDSPTYPDGPRRYGLHFLPMFLLYVIVVFGACYALMGCAGDPIVETRTSTSVVTVPKPVACVKDEDLPKLPETLRRSVPLTADTDQIAAATVADVEAYGLYIDAVQATLNKCKEAVK